jgi:penicillin amidase
VRRLVYIIGGSVVGLILVGALAIYLAVHASLPALDGELQASGLAEPASIERDVNGTPIIRTKSRRDLAFATGFAHAQDRFFQMDLMRRAAAGELAELLGSSMLETDKRLRAHAFRRVAGEVIANATPQDRELLAAYVAGVNAGLAHLGARPWEYLALRTEPEAWTAEDSVLTPLAMYLNLNDSTGEGELNRSRLRAILPAELFAFMHPLGTEWDAPVSGGTWRAPPIPGPEIFDLRRVTPPPAAVPGTSVSGEPAMAGSNSWAVAGTHAAGGAALLANDMHLGLRLPHVWYRARLIVEAEGDDGRDLVGVTLPGLPLLVVGSNGHVAWGYTNSYGDWTDLVIVEVDPRDPTRYRTADGTVPFTVRKETIAVRGAVPVDTQIRSTRWGPIVGEDDAGRPLALAWTAHDPRATNIRMLDFEAARSLDELLAAANRAGAPVQNFVAADSQGHIGWTIMGQVPVRSNYDPGAPASWQAADTGWTRWRTPEEYPRIVDPPAGRLWTANARTIDAEAWLPFLGEGGYDLGARAAQIRDDLLQLRVATAGDMVRVQLDDRALFLTRWRDLLLELLNDEATAKNPRRLRARQSIEHWSARAAAEDPGYAIVRAFRLRTRQQVFDALVAPARAAHPEARFAPSSQFEAPLWMLVTQRPVHLLDPRYPRWEDALLADLDAALEELSGECGDLESCTWGRHNTLHMRHPLSDALPFASSWLDMPAVPLPGDAAMPRVQGVSFGASQRLVVSPGRESEGYLQMPGGPVDHPLSPFYGAGHEAWVRGEPTPLLPGAAAHTLRLVPQG